MAIRRLGTAIASLSKIPLIALSLSLSSMTGLASIIMRSILFFLPL